MNFWLANALAAALVMLMRFPGVLGIGPIQDAPLVLVLSMWLRELLMGALLRWTGSLWPAIIVHQVSFIFAMIVWPV